MWTFSVTLDLHHGNKTHYDLWLHGMVAMSKFNRMELNKLQRSDCLAITGVMTMTPTAAMEVVLGFPPMHVITEPKAHAATYRLMCNHKWKLKSTMVRLQSPRTWSMNPTYRDR